MVWVLWHTGTRLSEKEIPQSRTRCPPRDDFALRVRAGPRARIQTSRTNPKIRVHPYLDFEMYEGSWNAPKRLVFIPAPVRNYRCRLSPPVGPRPRWRRHREMRFPCGIHRQESVLPLARTGCLNALQRPERKVQQPALAAIHGRECIGYTRFSHLFRRRLRSHAQLLRAQRLVIARVKADQVMLARIQAQYLDGDRLQRPQQLPIMLCHQRHIRSRQFNIDYASLQPLRVARAFARRNPVFQAKSAQAVQIGKETGDLLCSFLEIVYRHDK